MALLAPQHKLVLRHLLLRDGTAVPSELSKATGLKATHTDITEGISEGG